MNGKFKFIIAMLIFGSIGLFVKQIPLSSAEIAFCRGIIGSLFLISISFFTRQKPSWPLIRKNGLLLLFSGIAIGLNWILLFQSYKYTTIPNATLSYYCAPIFVLLLAPFVLKERLTLTKFACILTAMIGLFMIVQTGSGDTSGDYQHTVGILYGLSAAVLYAGVILLNKFIKDLPGFETTVMQLFIAALVLVPYVLLKNPFFGSHITGSSLLFILIVGIVHTGMAYFLYFTSLKDLPGQSIAVLSYIDPISAVMMAALFLGERMSLLQIFGGLLILSSTFLSEWLERKNRQPSTMASQP